MLKLPPGRFSMITGWPQRFCSSSPSTRMNTSLSPPAADDAITRTGRDG